MFSSDLLKQLNGKYKSSTIKKAEERLTKLFNLLSISSEKITQEDFVKNEQQILSHLQKLPKTGDTLNLIRFCKYCYPVESFLKLESLISKEVNMLIQNKIPTSLQFYKPLEELHSKFLQTKKICGNSNVDTLISAFYMYIPALRSQDYYSLIISDIDDDKTNIYMPNAKKIIINNYKTDKHYGKRIIKIPMKVLEILSDYIKNNEKKLKDILLTNTKNGKFTHSSFNYRLNRIFGAGISSDLLRRVWISEFLNYTSSPKDIEKLAIIMAHSIQTQKLTYKFTQTTSYSSQNHMKLIYYCFQEVIKS